MPIPNNARRNTVIIALKSLGAMHLHRGQRKVISERVAVWLAWQNWHSLVVYSINRAGQYVILPCPPLNLIPAYLSFELD